jgi:hypothetical protein
MKLLMLTAAFATALTTTLPVQAQRGSAPEQIRIPRGDNCYYSEGRATSWVGTFASNQRITVLTYSGTRGGRPQYDRHISVSGPGGFTATNAANFDQLENGLIFRTRAAGQYRFTMGPNALRGGLGFFEICAG